MSAANNMSLDSGAGGDQPDVTDYAEHIEEALFNMVQVNAESEDMKFLEDRIQESPDYKELVQLLEEDGHKTDDILGYVAGLVSHSASYYLSNADVSDTTLSERQQLYIKKLQQFTFQVLMIGAPTDINYHKEYTYKSGFTHQMVTAKLKIDEQRQRQKESEKFLASFKDTAKKMKYDYKAVFSFDEVKKVLEKFFQSCAAHLPRVIFNGHGSQHNGGSFVFGNTDSDREFIKNEDLAKETIAIFQKTCEEIFHKNVLRITFAQCYGHYIKDDKATGPDTKTIEGVNCVYLTSYLEGDNISTWKDTNVTHSNLVTGHEEINKNQSYILGRHNEGRRYGQADDQVDAPNVPVVPDLS